MTDPKVMTKQDIINKYPNADKVENKLGEESCITHMSKNILHILSHDDFLSIFGGKQTPLIERRYAPIFSHIKPYAFRLAHSQFGTLPPIEKEMDVITLFIDTFIELYNLTRTRITAPTIDSGSKTWFIKKFHGSPHVTHINAYDYWNLSTPYYSAEFDVDHCIDSQEAIHLRTRVACDAVRPFLQFGETVRFSLSLGVDVIQELQVYWSAHYRRQFTYIPLTDVQNSLQTLHSRLKYNDKPIDPIVLKDVMFFNDARRMYLSLRHVNGHGFAAIHRVLWMQYMQEISTPKTTSDVKVIADVLLKMSATALKPHITDSITTLIHAHSAQDFFKATLGKVVGCTGPVRVVLDVMRSPPTNLLMSCIATKLIGYSQAFDEYTVKLITQIICILMFDEYIGARVPGSRPRVLSQTMAGGILPCAAAALLAIPSGLAIIRYLITWGNGVPNLPEFTNLYAHIAQPIDLTAAQYIFQPNVRMLPYYDANYSFRISTFINTTERVGIGKIPTWSAVPYTTLIAALPYFLAKEGYIDALSVQHLKNAINSISELRVLNYLYEFDTAWKHFCMGPITPDVLVGTNLGITHIQMECAYSAVMLTETIPGHNYDLDFKPIMIREQMSFIEMCTGIAAAMAAIWPLTLHVVEHIVISDYLYSPEHIIALVRRLVPPICLPIFDLFIATSNGDINIQAAVSTLTQQTYTTGVLDAVLGDLHDRGLVTRASLSNHFTYRKRPDDQTDNCLAKTVTGQLMMGSMFEQWMINNPNMLVNQGVLLTGILASCRFGPLDNGLPLGDVVERLYNKHICLGQITIGRVPRLSSDKKRTLKQEMIERGSIILRTRFTRQRGNQIVGKRIVMFVAKDNHLYVSFGSI